MPMVSITGVSPSYQPTEWPCRLCVRFSGPSVEEVLAVLSRTFDMDYQSSIDLDKRLYGTYLGPLSRVVPRILQGYNFVLKTDNGRILVTVVGTPTSLAVPPAPQGLPPTGAPQAPLSAMFPFGPRVDGGDSRRYTRQRATSPSDSVDFGTPPLKKRCAAS
jgi:hypothetical protein